MPTNRDDHGKLIVNGEKEKPVKKTKVPPRSGWQEIVRQMQEEEKR